VRNHEDNFYQNEKNFKSDVRSSR